MFDSHNFFKQRLSDHIKELSRYLRYIFNGHIAVAMLFLISALAFYYQMWLEQLPEQFPVAWVIGILFGILASYNPVRTLLKEPDLVFLIAAEQQMNAYFRNALLYSFIIQLYIVLLVAAALGPLYFHSYSERPGKLYVLTIVVLLIFKGWNLLANWWMLHMQDQYVRLVDICVRLILNISVFYFIIKGNMVLAGMATILFVFLFIYVFSLSRKQVSINWPLLVEKDQGRLQSFYRLANMFTDVPHIKSPIKERKWLVSFVSQMVPFQKKYTYDYLYRITFLRSGDYLGMYVRLLIIGGLFIYFVPNEWMKLIFVLLFLYMSSFQMITLYHHHRTIMWIDLYPVELIERKRAFMKWLYELSFIQVILFSVIFLIQQAYIGFILALIGGVLFTVIFMNGYVSRKLTG